MSGSSQHCQSCGMPMKRDPQGGGTNKDGSRSEMYCSHCWQQGAYTQPDITLAQMQALVRLKLIEFGIPAFLTGLFTWRMGRLQRWRQ